MRAVFVFVMLAVQLGAADFLAYRRSGEAFVIQTTEGVAEIEWITGATFRYQRRTQPAVITKRLPHEPVSLKVADLDDRLELKSQHLTVSIFKQEMRLQVQDAEGKLLAVFPDGAMEHEFDLRKHSFFLGKSGYGLGTDRQGNCFFYYGPLPKEVLEQRHGTVDALPQFEARDLRLLTPADVPRQAERIRIPDGPPDWETLAAIVKSTVRDSMEAVTAPAFNLTEWDRAPEPLRRRAMQLAAVFPFVYSQQPLQNTQDLLALRSKLTSHFVTYFWEARERGFPLLRPLALQFSADLAAVAEDSVFMLGDELLIVPVTSPARTRSFYLPQGSWVDLATNKKYRGRQKLEIPVTDDRMPVFIRNGAILPLDGDPMILHYTPSLGAEYFLYEPDLEDYSQMHAAPSLDWMRLEIESKKTRDYDWIVHDVDRPKAVERAAQWRWDAASRNLYVSVHAAAGSDVIVNIRY